MQRLFACLRTAVFATLFVSLWTYFIPVWLAGSHAYEQPRPAGWILIALGAAIIVPPIALFAWRGYGTPAPFDPPRRLVVTGPYRFVRNPMYAGMAIVLTGEALTFPRLTTPLLITLAAFIVMTNAFVLLYEEPHLRGKFGDEYIEYCRHVRRWIPRVAPWYSHPHLE